MIKKLCLTLAVAGSLMLFIAGTLALFSTNPIGVYAQQGPGMDKSGQMPPMMRPDGGVAMTMDSTHIYIASGTTLYKISKATLEIEKSVEFRKGGMMPKMPKKRPFDDGEEHQEK